MKFTRPLVVISLGANVALVWLLARPAASTSGPHLSTTRVAVVGQRPTVAPATTVIATPEKPAESESYETWRARLLALGVPPDVVRDVIRACLEEPRLARQREFYAEAARRPWWQGGLGAQDITPAQQKELAALRKSERAEILRVLGPGGLATDADFERYSYLAPDKAAQLAVLEGDYNQARREANAATTAADPNRAERLRLLSEERERNLAALLTPEERATFGDRESSSAVSLSYRLDYFPMSDADYQTIMGIQKEFDAGFSPMGSTFGNPAKQQAVGDAFKKFETDLKAALGPDRYPLYLNAQRSEYRALVDLQQRQNLPQAAVDQIAQLQVASSAGSLRIADDATLDGPQKKAALAQLAEQARAGVRSALGPDLGNTYLAATSKTWIDLLDQGKAYASQPAGGSMTRPVIPDRRLAPAPPGR